ncbi:MAG: twin-arginine translocase subunit TatC [Sphingobacteriaceae bacterium]|nr:twin-arginine translocase subunit TatC [Sphingobacteriaceae bacterium]
MSNKGIIDTIKEKGQALDAEMSFFDHINVFRKHLFRAVIVIFAFMGVALWHTNFIFNTIVMGPKDPNFWTYRMMCKLAARFPEIVGKEFCVTKIDAKIINTEMSGQFTLQLQSCFTVGLILGIPYLLYEIWLFVKPALHDRERKSATGFVIFASLLFLVGILFGYYIICPLSINFLINFTVSPEILNTFTIDSYLSTVMTLTIGCGLMFQLPVLIYILSKLGIMTPQFMRSSRRYSTVIILIIAAVVTPTSDPYTMMIVAFPLFLLYEGSIFISAYIYRKKQKAEALFYKN